MMKFIKESIILILMLFASIYCYADNKQFVVVLDAGHGGHDAGAVGLPKPIEKKTLILL